MKKFKNEWRRCHPLSAVVRHGWKAGRHQHASITLVSPRGTVVEVKLTPTGWMGRKVPDWVLRTN